MNVLQLLSYLNEKHLMLCYVSNLHRAGHYTVIGGVCLSCLSVCRMPRPTGNSRTERPRKPKIGRMEAHDGWPMNLFRGQKVRGQGHQANKYCHRQCTLCRFWASQFLKISLFYSLMQWWWCDDDDDEGGYKDHWEDTTWWRELEARDSRNTSDEVTSTSQHHSSLPGRSSGLNEWMM